MATALSPEKHKSTLPRIASDLGARSRQRCLTPAVTASA
jgi:hypothetical protein